MQTIINDFTEQCKEEIRDKDSETDSEKESIHSNWSDVVPTEIDNPIDTVVDIPQKKRTVRNIVLVLINPNQKIGVVGRLDPPTQLAQLLVLFQMIVSIFKIQKVN